MKERRRSTLNLACPLIRGLAPCRRMPCIIVLYFLTVTPRGTRGRCRCRDKRDSLSHLITAIARPNSIGLRKDTSSSPIAWLIDRNDGGKKNVTSIFLFLTVWWNCSSFFFWDIVNYYGIVRWRIQLSIVFVVRSIIDVEMLSSCSFFLTDAIEKLYSKMSKLKYIAFPNFGDR